MKAQRNFDSQRTLFYDVDTQRDFMLPGGALHVPGSENILPALKELTELARRRNIRRVCSMDRHFKNDRELAHNGGPWPDHCMDGTEGQHKVEETALVNPLSIPSHTVRNDQLEAAVGDSRELVLEKQDVDVLVGNTNARSIFSKLVKRYDHILVYGVYTDVCVDYAVEALLEQGVKPYIVVDAIHEIDPAKATAARHRWSERGVRRITSRQLQNLLDD
jgi:nicotinamidase/pyrazinamidase